MGFDHAPVGSVCQSWGPGGALKKHCCGSRGRSPREALDLRAFEVLGLDHFEDLPTHLKPKESLQK